MKPNTARVLRALFYAYVAVTFLHIAYVVSREPFAFDAWNVAVDTGAKPPSIGRFFSFWHQQYTSSNPRIGQPLAYLAYKLWGFAEIGTPLAFFAIVLGGFVLGTGRWPDRRNGRDLATLAIGIGFLWFASPNLPAYMFCRAYATNYVWAAAFQIWFLVVLRLHDPGGPRPSPAKLVGVLAFGVLAGMCNEHTGPTLILFVIVYALWHWRKQRVLPAFHCVGVLGAIIGYAMLFFAPGQGQRYDSLAERYNVAQQVLVRGLRGNLDIFLNLLYAAAPLMVVIVAIVAVGALGEQRTDTESLDARKQQRQAIVIVGLGIVAAFLVTATIFASPKLGPRFFMHVMLVLLAGSMGMMSSFLYRARTFIPFVVVAVLSSAYAFGRTVPMFTRLDHDSDRRLAELAAMPPNGNYTATGWEQIPESWWFLGDDVRDQKKQELVAKYFGLDRVLFRGSDLWTTLGVTDVKLTMHYEFDHDLCLDKIDELDLKPYVGRDIAALHHAFLDTIAEIRRVVTDAHLRSIDLVATFLGPQPPMPRKTNFVARWKEGVLEGYTASMRRIGRSRDREIIPQGELKHSEWEMFLVAIGDPPRRLGVSTSTTPLTYQPWTSGQYWVLACKTDYCFVVYTVHHNV